MQSVGTREIHQFIQCGGLKGQIRQESPNYWVYETLSAVNLDILASSRYGSKSRHDFRRG